ncbi:MAG: PEP-CTERM sorting domain-containing protein [Phycisphaerae bacterium]
MRYCKLLLMCGMVLVLSSPTWAIPKNIPFQTAYDGPVSWHFSNWDEGRVYTGLLAGGLTPVTVNHVYAPAELQSIAPVGPVGAGDAWGIIRVETILNAIMTGPNSMTIGGTLLYTYGDSGTELAGLYYGRQDDQIIFNADGSQTIYSDPLGYYGDRVDLYIQPAGTAANWATGMAGPGASGAAGVYPNIGDDPDSTLVLTGYVTPGFFNGGTDGVFSKFTPAGNTGEGTYGLYLTWDGGTDLEHFGSPTTAGIFPFLGGTGAPYDADARLKGFIDPTIYPVADPWLVSTSDPAFMNVVPEPATMVMLALGGAGLFLRKRRRG